MANLSEYKPLSVVELDMFKKINPSGDIKCNENRSRSYFPSLY